MFQRRLLSLSSHVRGPILAAVLLGLGISACYVGQGLLTAVGLARIFAGEHLSSIVPLLLAILLLICVRAALIWLCEVNAMRTVAAVKKALRERLYARLLDLGPGYLERNQTGKVQASLVDGVEALEGYFGYYLPQALVALIAPALVIAYLFTLDPVVGVLVLVCVALVPLAPRLWDRLLGEYGRSHWRAYSEVNAQFVDSMQGMATLKAFGAGVRRGQALHERVMELYRKTMSQLSVSMISKGVVGLAMGAGTALAVGVGAMRLLEGALALPELLIILFLVGECFRALVELDSYWHQGYMGISASSGIFALLDAEPEIKEAATTMPFAVAGCPALRFEHVTFAYDGGNRPALCGLSFAIEPGQTVALVGRSGAGKTTVVSLLLRFFDPQEGRISVDGRDLHSYPLTALRRLTAVVSQDTYLFHGTVADNLRLGKPEATQGELEEAARAANAHDFIEALPQGYKTIVGERGQKLSGGQRQRLAIARALLKNAPVLILDEATSSVDAANEALIQEALERLTANRTTLLIAHRLSTVVHADKIVVMADGRAVETGRHHELLAKRGAYSRLVDAQQGGCDGEPYPRAPYPV